MSKEKKTFISLDAVRLNTKSGELEYQIMWKVNDEQEDSWELRSWLLENDYESQILQFEKNNESRSSRGVRKSPRLKRTRTRSPSKKKESSPEPLNLDVSDSPSDTKEAEDAPNTYDSIVPEANFWMIWAIAIVGTIIASVVAKTAKIVTTTKSESKWLVDAFQFVDVLPIIIASIAVVAKPGAEIEKLVEFRKRAFLSLVWLSAVIFLEELRHSQLVHLLPFDEHLVAWLPSLQLLAHFIWVGFFREAYKQARKGDTGIEELYSQIFSVVLLSSLDYAGLSGDLNFGYFAILYQSTYTVIGGIGHLLTQGMVKTGTNELYMLTAQWIVFFFTVVFVMQEKFGGRFENTRHISVGEFQLHIDTLSVLQIILKWMFAALLVGISIS